MLHGVITTLLNGRKSGAIVIGTSRLLPKNVSELRPCISQRLYQSATGGNLRVSNTLKPQIPRPGHRTDIAYTPSALGCHNERHDALPDFLELNTWRQVPHNIAWRLVKLLRYPPLNATYPRASEDHETVTRLLGENGTDINAQSSDRGKTLQGAEFKDHGVVAIELDTLRARCNLGRLRDTMGKHHNRRHWAANCQFCIHTGMADGYSEQERCGIPQARTATRLFGDIV